MFANVHTFICMSQLLCLTKHKDAAKSCSCDPIGSATSLLVSLLSGRELSSLVQNFWHHVQRPHAHCHL